MKRRACASRNTTDTGEWDNSDTAQEALYSWKHPDPSLTGNSNARLSTAVWANISLTRAYALIVPILHALESTVNYLER